MFKNGAWTAGAALMEGAFTWQNSVAPALSRPCKRILIHGGAGGMGTLFIQFARAQGLEVFVTVSSPEKAQLCQQLGATQAIIYTQEAFDQAILTFTQEEGVDVIVDCIGGDTLAQNIACLAPGGWLVQIGAMAGSKALLPLVPLMRKGLVLTGATLRDKPLAHKAALAHQVESWLPPLLALAQVKPVVHQVFPMAQASAAVALMEAGGYAGKLVLVV